MNETVKLFLLTADRFLPELHFRKPLFTYSAGGPLMKIVKKFESLKYIYKNELDKACFTLDAVYANSKDFAKKAASDIILKGRAYEIAIKPKNNGYQRGLVSTVYNFFDKK